MPLRSPGPPRGHAALEPGTPREEEEEEPGLGAGPGREGSGARGRLVDLDNTNHIGYLERLTSQGMSGGVGSYILYFLFCWSYLKGYDNNTKTLIPLSGYSWGDSLRKSSSI